MALTAQQRATAAAKYPEIVAAVNRLASAQAAPPPAPEEWMQQWNARSQANYDAAGPEIMATANLRRKAMAPQGIVSLGPFPQAGPKAIAAAQPTQDLAAAFQAAKAAVAARGGPRKSASRLSPDELRANALAYQQRQASERAARDQRKAFSREARAFKRMAGLGARDGIMAMPMLSPRDQFEMEMARTGMQHGQQMDLRQLGLDQQKIRELSRQFDRTAGLSEQQLGLQKELGTGELDVRRQGITSQEQMAGADIAMREKLGLSAADVQKLQIEMERAARQEENRTRENLGMEGFKTNKAIANIEADTSRYNVDANYDIGMSGLDNQLKLGTGLQDVERLKSENLLKGTMAGYESDQSMAQLKDSFAREALKQSGTQFDKTLSFQDQQADRSDYYNRRDFAQDVRQGFRQEQLDRDRMAMQRRGMDQNYNLNRDQLAQGIEQLDMQRRMQEHQMTKQNLTDSEKAAFGAFQGRPDLQARSLQGEDLSSLAREMQSNLSPETRREILANANGSARAVTQQLRMLGLNEEQVKQEFERITGSMYFGHSAREQIPWYAPGASAFRLQIPKLNPIE